MRTLFKETTYGFEYGAAKVTLLYSYSKKGWVIFVLSTKKYPALEIYVTKTGKVRVFNGRKEWKDEP